MKQKKTMRLWQMIIILLLSVTMVITMFLPAFRVDSKARRKQIDVINKDEELLEQLEKNYNSQDGSSLFNIPDSLSESGDELGGMPDQGDETVEGADNEYTGVPETEDESSKRMIEDMENGLETFDENIEKYEEESNSHVIKISPFRIMTNSFEKLVLGNNITTKISAEMEKENPAFAAIEKSYNRSRILLWIVYISVLIVVVLILLGFFLKWNKFIPLIINTIYGVAAAIIFGYLRFAYIKGIAKHIDGADLGKLSWSEIFGLTGFNDISSSGLAKLLSAFYSIAFLMAFIIAIAFIIISVISMLTGNRAVNSNDFDLTDDWEIGNEIQTIAQGNIAEKGSNPFAEQGEAITQPASVPIEVSSKPSVFDPKPSKSSPAPKAQQMGQVRCTKGIAVGQGFMLPQDRKVIIGKSPQSANLVINNQNVSNIHCSIRYNPGMNTYIIKDHSMNGTFVNGVRLQKDAAIEYPAGTVLSLADGSNEITLG